MTSEKLIGFENLPQTLPHYCIESFRRNNKTNALSYKINDVWENISGENVIEKIKYIALGLAALGVKAGDRIAIISENRPEWSLTDLAILSLRAVNVRRADSLYPGRFRRENAFCFGQKTVETR